MGGSGDAKGMGINSYGNSTLIEYNEIRNCGFQGIVFNGSNTTVKNNYVDTFCYNKDDGGGIYTFGGVGTNIPYVSNRKVIGNIVLNGIGALNGAYNPWGDAAQGLYFDNGSMNIEATGNTVFNASDMAMLLNGVKNIKISGNTFYAPAARHIVMDERLNHPTIRNNSTSNNIMFVKNVSEVYILRRSESSSTDLFGTISGNYYARPMDANTATVKTKVKAYDAYPRFKDYTTAVRFEFNATKVAKTIALDATYTDAKSINYSGSITLQPYTSAILIRTGSITNVATTSTVAPIISQRSINKPSINVDSLNREKSKSLNLKVFPNPAVNKIQISVEGIQETNQKAQLAITSVSGIVVKSIPVTLSGKTIEADVSSLITGMYVATIIKNNTIISKRFLKN
jgi:hypothetical protein